MKLPPIANLIIALVTIIIVQIILHSCTKNELKQVKTALKETETSLEVNTLAIKQIQVVSAVNADLVKELNQFKRLLETSAQETRNEIRRLALDNPTVKVWTDTVIPVELVRLRAGDTGQVSNNSAQTGS